LNKGLLVTLAVISEMASHVGGFFRDAIGYTEVGSSTPSISGRGGSHRFRPHAPNDGRWHMKYHRSRH